MSVTGVGRVGTVGTVATLTVFNRSPIVNKKKSLRRD